MPQLFGNLEHEAPAWQQHSQHQGPATAGCSSSGYPDLTPVAMVHSVAIVGAGRMGQQYAMAYKTYPDAEIVAFVDPNVERELHPTPPPPAPLHRGVCLASPRRPPPNTGCAQAQARLRAVRVAHQFATVPELLESGVDPAIVAVVTPAKYMHETIVAAASELTAPTTTHRRRRRVM